MTTAPDERFWRTPLDLDQVRIPHGEVQVIVERCKGCEFCVEYCPRGVLAMSEDFNAKGYHYPVAVKANSCVDCSLCQMICPEFAIFTHSAAPQTVAEAEADPLSRPQAAGPAPVRQGTPVGTACDSKAATSQGGLPKGPATPEARSDS